MEKNSIAVLLCSPHKKTSFNSASVYVVTANHEYSFFPYHAETILVLENATILLSETQETFKIISGIMLFKENVLTCISETITQIKKSSDM